MRKRVAQCLALSLDTVSECQWVHSDCLRCQLKVWVRLSDSPGSNHGSIAHVVSMTLEDWGISLNFSC